MSQQIDNAEVKLLVSLLIFLLALSDANAEFRATAPPEVGQGPYALECAILKCTDDQRKDRDPIYKISVLVSFDKNHKLDTLSVIHTSVAGNTYDRSNQYGQASIWQTPGRMEYYWKGARNNTEMVGEVWHSAEGKWFYSER